MLWWPLEPKIQHWQVTIRGGVAGNSIHHPGLAPEFSNYYVHVISMISFLEDNDPQSVYLAKGRK